MSHPEQVAFISSVRDKFPDLFRNTKAIDIGSGDINGNNRHWFSDSLYLGVDVVAAPNVDIVSPGHKIPFVDSWFGVVISTECLEHDMFYKETLKKMVALLCVGGLLVFTCATTGREVHGTVDKHPYCTYHLGLKDSEWANYYKNITEKDVREVLDIESMFSQFEFSVNENTSDLYFYGIKK